MPDKIPFYKRINLFLVGGIVFLVAGIGVIYFIWQEEASRINAEVQATIDMPLPKVKNRVKGVKIFDPSADGDGDGLSNADEIELYKTDPEKADTDGDGFPDKMELDFGYNPLETVSSTLALNMENINIDWYDFRRLVSSDTVFVSVEQLVKKYPDLIDKKGKINFLGQELSPKSFFEKLKIEVLGSVRDGKYKDAKYYSLDYGDQVLYFLETSFGLLATSGLVDQKNLTNKKSIYYWQSIFINASNFYIANLEPPAMLRIPNSTVLLAKEKVIGPSAIFIDKYWSSKQFEYLPNKFIYNGDGCLATKANDGTARLYNIVLPFSDTSEKIIPKIKWSDGTENNQVYTRANIDACYSRPGCGFYPKFISEIDLKPTGVASDNSIIYEIKENSINAMANELLISLAGQNKSLSISESSPEQFLADHPLIFWKDPFGRYMALTNLKYKASNKCR